ncbi:MAG TPA: DUF3368 domain-containing protein [Thermoanaerobaculia bacterium]|nr:DUF3368 domain-containing protein [Thermoanaerobaculia bacterium]
MIVVCDASPIIGLSAVGKLSLLHQLYGNILVSESVAREVAADGSALPGADALQGSDWITVQPVGDSVLLRALDAELDQGEAEAIALAVELQADLLLVDERRARKVALRSAFPSWEFLVCSSRQRGSTFYQQFALFSTIC